MGTDFRVDSAGFERRCATQSHKRLMLLAGITAIGVLSASCAPTAPTPFLGPDPSDPSVRVPRVEYRSTIASYRTRRPVEPGPWPKQNEGVNPNSGQ